MKKLWRHFIIAIGLSALLPALLSAQQVSKDPHVGYIYPAGARQATTQQVVIGGEFLDGVTEAIVSGAGVHATVIEHLKPIAAGQANRLREAMQELRDRRNEAMGRGPASTRSATHPAATWTPEDENLLDEIRMKLSSFVRKPSSAAIAETVIAQITVDADAPLGRHELRLVTNTGLTDPMGFYVGQLPEVAEKPAKPTNDNTHSVAANQMNVTLPVLINGQIMPGGINRYKFTATKGQHLIAAASARELVPYMADAVPGWFQAMLTLRNASGRELACDDDSRFSSDPVIHWRIAEDGQYTIEIKDALSRGREDFVYRLAIGELPFVTGVFPLGGRAGTNIELDINGWNLPIKHLVWDASKAKPGVYPLAIKGLTFLPTRVPVAIDSLPEYLAQEPNSDQATAQSVTLPAIVNGHIAQGSDVHFFRIDGKAGQEFVAEVIARRLDSPLDSVLQLTDVAGRQIAYNDDFEDKGAGLITHQADSYIRTTLPSDGTYFIKLWDVQNQGGPDYSYRLRLSAPRPDFELRAVPSSIDFRKGSNAEVTIYALRRDGFTGPVNIGLTAGTAAFKLSGGPIKADQSQARFTIASSVPATQPVRIQFEGWATIDGRDVVHRAIPADDMMQAFAYHHLVPADQLMAEVLPTPTRQQIAGPVSAASLKRAAEIIGKYTADKLALPADKSDRFIAAYISQRLAGFEKIRDAAKQGKYQELVADITDTSKAMRSVLDAQLARTQVSTAMETLGPLFGDFDRELGFLLDSGVSETNIARALPILSRYEHQADGEVFEKLLNGLMTPPDAGIKAHDLRAATIKDLADIIGSDLANKWAERPAFGLRGSVRGGK